MSLVHADPLAEAFAASKRQLQAEGVNGPPPADVRAPLPRKPTGGAHAARAKSDRQPAVPLRALRVMSAREAMDAPLRSYLLGGLIAPRELSVWWGAPKCGKSFLLLRAAYGLALGLGMWGRSVAEPVRTLYLAGEGESGLGLRLRALHDELGDPGDAFAVIAQRMELGPPSTDLEAVVHAARMHRAGLVVVDTLARTFGPGNEDTAQDMGGFVSAMDRLREEAGAHVAVVHHGPKDPDAKTPRGSVALVGAADLVVKVKKGAEGSPSVAVVEAAKDDADGAELPFTLRLVALGTRDDGSAITTCLATDDGGVVRRTAARVALSPAAQKAVTFLSDLLADEGSPLPVGPDWPSARDLRGVPVERWRAECEARGLSLAEKSDDRRRAIDRAMTQAGTAGAVAVRNGLAWLVRKGLFQ